MDRKALGQHLLGVAGMALLVASVVLRLTPTVDLRWYVVAVSGFATLLAVGGTLILPELSRFVASFAVVGTMLVGVVPVAMVFDYFRLWEVPALALGAVLLMVAFWMGSEGRERVRIAVLCALSAPVVLLLATLVAASLDKPWF